MKKLLVVSSAPAALSEGQPYLDIKFCEGMKYYSAEWDGPVSTVLAQRPETFPFGQIYPPESLPFDLHLTAPQEDFPVAALDDADVVLCSGDSHQYLDLPALCRRSGTKLVYVIEYVFKARRQSVFLDPQYGLAKKMYSLVWHGRQEWRRRRAFRQCDGIQANGYPAMEAYRPLNSNTILYLDNRVHAGLLVTGEEGAARRSHLLAGKPLRILHSGRLEPMKGAQDLIPIATRLRDQGVPFEMDIFGVGSLAADIRQKIGTENLSAHVRLNDPVDFETELVPFARTRADIFLSCHRQSDPSCTYIESFGCGLPIAGYANEMWRGLQDASQAGWVVPFGDWKGLADQVADLSRKREDVVAKAALATDFARDHLFEKEFQRRVDHLKALV